VDHLVDARVSEAFRVHIPERPTFSLLRSKAGIIGRPIGETSGTVVDQVAARAGVIRVSNGFRCPDDMTNGGTFTDAMGTTCGVRVVMAAVEEIATQVRSGASGGHSSEVGSAIDRIRDSKNDTGRIAKMEDATRNLAQMMSMHESPSRVRLTANELLPEALDADMPDRAVEMVMAHRPDQLYPTIDGPVGDAVNKMVLSQEDLDSDTYIRSLGAAVFADLNSQADEVRQKLGELDSARVERAAARQAAEDQYKEVSASMKESGEAVAKALQAVLPRATFDGRTMGRYGLVVDGKIDPSSIGRSPSAPGVVHMANHTWGVDLPNGELLDIRVLIPAVNDVSAPDINDGGVQPLIEFGHYVNNRRADELVPDLNGTPAQVAAAKALDFFTTGFAGQPNDRNDYLASVVEDVAAGFSASPLSEIIDSERLIATKIDPVLDGKAGAPLQHDYDIVRTALYDTMKRHGFQAGSLSPEDVQHITTDAERDARLERIAKGATPGYRISEDFDQHQAAMLEDSLGRVLQLMPKSWAEGLRTNGISFIKDTNRKERAYARDLGAGKGTEINLPTEYFNNQDDLEGVLLHELTHGVQHNDRRISEAEFVFFRRRVSGSVSVERLSDVYPSSGYDASEKTVPDDSDDAYMFKLYDTWNEHRPYHISEISPMVMETLQGKRRKSGGDLDIQSFMIGLLMEYGVPRERK
jgi:hypothetical protein